jgi:hypothetical protein
MLSRLHYLLEMACAASDGRVRLEAWCQGGQLAGRKVEVAKVKASRGGNEYFWEEADHSEDYGRPPTPLPPLDSEFTAVGLEYVSNLPWARSLV